MIVEYIRYNIPAEDQATFERAYASAAPALDASPHCLGYELARNGDPWQRTPPKLTTAAPTTRPL